MNTNKKILTTIYEDEHAIDIKTPSETALGCGIGFGLSIFFLVLMCL